MSIDPELLVSNAIARADSTAASAEQAIDDIKSHRISYSYGPTVNVDFNGFPNYVKPATDKTPFPVYETPAAALPVTPVLKAVSDVTVPAFPDAPSAIVTSDLFKQQSPSTNIPDWTEADPELMIDSLISEMNAIAKPVIDDFEFPALSAMVLRDAPSLSIPGYSAPLTPDTLIEPINYSNDFQANYNRMLPEMQGFINDKVASTLDTYCPGFTSTRNALDAKLSAGLTSTVLPDQIENAMFTRANARAAVEYDAAIYDSFDEFTKSGLMQPPGLAVGRQFEAKMKKAGSLANQANEIYMDRKKMEVQHLQFVMGLASTYRQTVLQLTVQYAEMMGKTIQYATAFSAEKTDRLIKVYDHLIERQRMIIAVMDVLGRQFEIRLKAALAELDGFKLELEAEKAKKDVENAQVQAIESRIRAQDNKVKLYSELISAISKKGALEELKIKGYDIRANAYKTRLQAQLAGFDVYKASLEGDKAKLDGRMTSYTIYEAQLKAVTAELDAHFKSAQNTIEANRSKVQAFEAGASVYKMSAEAALQKFTQLAEIKKLGQSIYSTELNAGIEVFKAETQQVTAKIDAVLREYEGRIKSFVSSGELNLENSKMNQQAAIAVATLSGDIAAAASGAINSMASVVSTVSG